MKILSEIGWGDKVGGARRVAVLVLQNLAQNHPEHSYSVVSCGPYEALKKFQVDQYFVRPPQYIPRILWDQLFFPHWVVPRQGCKIKPDLIHYTNNIASFWNRVPFVVTIHDMTPFMIPESYYSTHGAYQRLYFQFAAKKSTKIITVSENSKNDICKILGVSEKKVVVAPLASGLRGDGQNVASDFERIQKKFSLNCPFILYVGAIHPRKNVGRIIEAFAKLKAEKSIEHKLIIAGAERWQTKSLHIEAALHNLENQMIFTGALDDRSLIALYSNCDVFVWPSLYEGFGLPVIEAMECGAPVVTSNTSSLPEVAGSAALLVDPTSVEEIAAAVFAVLDNPTFSSQLRKKGKGRAATYSWSRTADIIASTYESV